MRPTHPCLFCGHASTEVCRSVMETLPLAARSRCSGCLDECVAGELPGSPRSSPGPRMSPPDLILLSGSKWPA